MGHRLCPHCLEAILDGSETATVKNGDDRYPHQVMHVDCAEEYLTAHPIEWPSGHTTEPILTGDTDSWDTWVVTL